MTSVIPEGTYYIRSRATRTLLKVIGPDNNVVGHSHELSLLTRQLFYVSTSFNDDNRIIINNIRTNKVIAINGGKAQCEDLNPSHLGQEWTPVQVPGEAVGKFYILINAGSTNTVLDLASAGAQDNNPVIGYGRHSGPNQQWEFILVPDYHPHGQPTDPSENPNVTPQELQVWKDRAAAAETKAKEAEEKAAAAGAKVAGAEKKAKDAEEKASATEARAAAAEAKAKSAEAKASALTKNVDELTTKVKTLGDELSTEHKSDEARELNRKWLRDMLCYFEYRYGESPDLVGKYPYLSGHVDNAESWEWVKGKISGLTGSG